MLIHRACQKEFGIVLGKLFNRYRDFLLFFHDRMGPHLHKYTEEIQGLEKLLKSTERNLHKISSHLNEKQLEQLFGFIKSLKWKISDSIIKGNIQYNPPISPAESQRLKI